ncbi:MAG: hypothetical protein F4118_11235 [Acidimicrobiaceae bacterium]|nr:hypothetical protein [Acidimicrobiaceae bacterium]MYI36980.1 hypothetical protein [Acidimicrobiaceae bacterium]
MAEEKPRADEQAAADAICAVEDVEQCERLVPSGSVKTPDWRVLMSDGRVADVEVTLCTDEAGVRFMQSFSPRGSARRWPDERLSYVWTVIATDHTPTANRHLPLHELMNAVCDVLVSVEGRSYSPQQMRGAADTVLRLDPEMMRCCGGTRSVDVVKVPQHVGSGRGAVRTYGNAPQGGRVDYRRLIPVIQECINAKAGEAQLDNAPDLRWLAVMLEMEPASLLNEFFGPGSPSPHPSMDAITFDYFHEVWVVAQSRGGEDNAEETYTVLRLFKPGDSQERHIVPRS